MAPVKEFAVLPPRRGRPGRSSEIRLDGEARARRCGRLAAHWWREAGTPEVASIAPQPGCDFNDELKRRILSENARRLYRLP